MGESDSGPSGGKRHKKPRRILVYATAVPVADSGILENNDIIVILKENPGEQLSKTYSVSSVVYAFASSDRQFNDVNGKRIRKNGDRYHTNNVEYGHDRDLRANPGYYHFLQSLVKSNRVSSVDYYGLVRRIFELEHKCSKAKNQLDSTVVNRLLLDEPGL